MLETVSRLSTERRLLFIGSGFSTALGMPSWRYLLEKTTKENVAIRNQAHVLELLKHPGCEYDVADELSRDDILGRYKLESKLISIIREYQDKIYQRSDLPLWMELTRQLGLRGIITTNWDTLLTTISKFEPLIWPRDSTEFVEALRNNRPFVLYLHGNVDNRSLVITHEDAERQAEVFRQHQLRLETILAIHTLIIIGSGFPDPHINELYNIASSLAGHNSRIRLILTREAEEKKLLRIRPSLRRGSVVVTYKDYPDFREALINVASYCDPSSKLAGIRSIHLTSPVNRNLYDLVSEQPYNFDTSSMMRLHYLASPIRSHLLDLSAEFLLENDNLNDKISSGLFATILSTIGELWRPRKIILQKLNQLCGRILDDADTSLIGVIEPLVFTLGLKGFVKTHKKYLDAAINHQSWRIEDAARIGDYYEQPIKQALAIERHLRDKRRTGLLLANDIARLLNLLASMPMKEIQILISPLLDKSTEILYVEGQDTLVKKVKEEKERILNERHKIKPRYRNL